MFQKGFVIYTLLHIYQRNIFPVIHFCLFALLKFFVLHYLWMLSSLFYIQGTCDLYSLRCTTASERIYIQNTSTFFNGILFKRDWNSEGDKLGFETIRPDIRQIIFYVILQKIPTFSILKGRRKCFLF